MQLYSFRNGLGLLSLLLIPVVCLSMGGCPPQNGGGQAVCGNGSVESGEECDDGNTTSGDGCSADCEDEVNGGVCGDGIQDDGEECDDGDTDDGDGCDSECRIETGQNPPDGDGDGVPDEFDECPGTRRNEQVDEDGCPTDPDGDGVAGLDDQCPNTPAGAAVDEDGCSASQRDSDGDGIPDSQDACVDVPAGDVDEDQDGCPDVDPGGDDDDDGVINADDLCPHTPADEEADQQGCSPSQTPPECGNGEVEAGEQCDDGNTSNGDGCSSTCQNEGGGGGPVCGNGTVEAGEQCDDGNTSNGDGCSSTCQNESTGIANDNCANPTPVTEGTRLFSNAGATTDGPLELEMCSFFGRSDIRSDIWYCYTATCSGQAVISLCGSGYDTKMAVYSGCACPAGGSSDRVLACSDDDCGTGLDNIQSRVEVSVAAGQSYLIRVGGFFGNREQGDGRLTIRCGENTCFSGSGSCTTPHDDNQPGCDDPSCCNQVCDVDTFCCDVTWDAFCASQADGFCSAGGFPSCNASAGDCATVQNGPGCNNDECCEGVCQSDPFCCITSWDANCVDRADLVCSSCGRGQGDCLSARTEPGCNDVSCCAIVCTADEFCCNEEWDAACVQAAQELCR